MKPVFFANPRKLPETKEIPGRVVVLDIAFASVGLSPGYDDVTEPFINGLGNRLAKWIDHHDHPYHARFEGDPRFLLTTKAAHPACPELISPELVEATGEVDSFVCHYDFDGLFSTAKWMLGGREPYPGSDRDARAVDSRIGEISDMGSVIDRGIRARFRKSSFKLTVLRFLLSGCDTRSQEWKEIRAAAQEYEATAEQARKLAEKYEVMGSLALVKVPGHSPRFDKTELLMIGQNMAPVSAVVHSGNIAVAARFDSGIDLLTLLGVAGGMPTRVSVPLSYMQKVLAIGALSLEELRGQSSGGGHDDDQET